jgi:hypothetical protein
MDGDPGPHGDCRYWGSASVRAHDPQLQQVLAHRLPEGRFEPELVPEDQG